MRAQKLDAQRGSKHWAEERSAGSPSSASVAPPTRSVPPRCAALGAAAVTPETMPPSTAARPDRGAARWHGASRCPSALVVRGVGRRRRRRPPTAPPPAIVSVDGASRPAGTVYITRLVAGSMRETVPSWRFALHTPPSPTVTGDLGPFPTAIARYNLAGTRIDARNERHGLLGHHPDRIHPRGQRDRMAAQRRCAASPGPSADRCARPPSPPRRRPRPRRSRRRLLAGRCRRGCAG